MAIDQRDVSSKLRFMDDGALQQYAAMHKNDPYIFPLAFQESQNRQRLRMQQQAQAGAQPQPKVADQALAQMAPQQAQPMPEDVGIGALPAQNMQFAAEGGIMGYEGYDEGPSDFGQEPVLRMAEGGHVPRYQGNPQDRSLVRMPYNQPTTNMTGEIPGFVAGTPIFQTQPGVDPEEPFFRRLLRENTEAIEKQRTQEARARAAKGQPLSAEDQARVAKADKAKAVADTSAQDMAQFDAASNLYMTERAAKQAAEKPAAKKDDAASKPDTTRRNVSDPSAVRTDPSAARKESAPATTDVTGMFETALEKADKKANPYEEQIKAVNAAKVKAGEENVSGLEAIQKQFADIYKGRKERLDTRENEIGKMKDQSLGLALLNAGAAMMQTRGSIGTAIGAGIDTGSKQYVAGLDKINAAKDKLSDARDRLEEIEAQRGEVSAGELHNARNEVKSLTTAGMENLIQAAMAERKINRAEAVDFVKAQLTVSTADKDRSSREDIANMQERGQSARSAAQIAATLNTPDRLVFNQLLKDNGNDAVKAAEALQKMKAEKFNVYDSYSKYLTGFAGKDAAMVGVPESITKYASRFAALTPPAPVDTSKPTRP
jgi:hypothetical protein